jgi:hypothetical protein
MRNISLISLLILTLTACVDSKDIDNSLAQDELPSRQSMSENLTNIFKDKPYEKGSITIAELTLDSTFVKIPSCELPRINIERSILTAFNKVYSTEKIELTNQWHVSSSLGEPKSGATYITSGFPIIITYCSLDKQ